MSWLNPISYIKQKAKLFLSQGSSANKLALAFSIGMIIGTIPLIGVSTALCALIATLFGLNHLAIQVANYIAYPLQLILIIPFMQLGQWIFNFRSFPAAPRQIIAHFREDWIVAIGDFWLACLAAVLAWLVMAIPAAFILNKLLLHIFRRMKTAISP